MQCTNNNTIGVFPMVFFIWSDNMENLSKKNNVKRLVVSAMFIAISVAINELLKFDLTFIHGGSVTAFSMVPLALIGWTWGAKWGFACGAIMGLIDMFIGGLANFSYVSGIVAYLVLILFDYVVAYGCAGLVGIVKNKIKNKTVAIGIGATFACLLRFLCHFLTGVTIWADYSENITAVIIGSITYNGAYMLPELIITVIGCVAVINVKPIINSLER